MESPAAPVGEAGREQSWAAGWVALQDRTLESGTPRPKEGSAAQRPHPASSSVCQASRSSAFAGQLPAAQQHEVRCEGRSDLTLQGGRLSPREGRGEEIPKQLSRSSLG